MAVETGFSDFHKMTLTVMKVFYKKMKNKYYGYRNSKQFSKGVIISYRVIKGLPHENRLSKYVLLLGNVYTVV